MLCMTSTISPGVAVGREAGGRALVAGRGRALLDQLPHEVGRGDGDRDRVHPEQLGVQRVDHARRRRRASAFIAMRVIMFAV